MDDLIKRLEAATGPDEILDGEIWHAVIGRPHDVWARDDDGILMLQDPEDPIAFGRAPRYTASIDAAMTLVPEGFDHRSGTYNGGKSFNAVVTTPELAAWTWDTGCESAANQAIALVIAALKARQ